MVGTRCAASDFKEQSDASSSQAKRHPSSPTTSAHGQIVILVGTRCAASDFKEHSDATTSQTTQHPSRSPTFAHGQIGRGAARPYQLAVEQYLSKFWRIYFLAMNHSNPDFAYFIACVPDTLAKQRILEEYEKLGLNLRLRTEDVWHITLNDLGDSLPLHTIDTVDRVCRETAAATAPFNVVLDRVLSFKHNRALALNSQHEPNSELKAFRRTLRLKLLDHGVSTPSSFTPHLTLLYGDHSVDKLISPPITWQINEFVLVRSHQGRTHHDHLQRWKLQGTPDSKPAQAELF